MSFTAIAAYIVYFPLEPYTYLTHITKNANQVAAFLFHCSDYCNGLILFS